MNHCIIDCSVGKINILICCMLNILHVLSNQLVHLQDIRIAIAKYFVSIHFPIRALGPSDQFAESFKSAPQGWLEVQGFFIAFNSHLPFELLFQYKPKQIVSCSTIWDIHVLIQVQMVVLEQITRIPAVLRQTGSGKCLFSIIESIQFDAGNSKFIPILG